MNIFSFMFFILVAFSIVSGLLIASPLKRWHGDSATRAKGFFVFAAVFIFNMYLSHGWTSIMCVAIFLPSLVVLFPFYPKPKSDHDHSA
jgi:Ca2+/Na+ antiporter